MVSYYFTHEAADILPSKLFWIKVMKLILIVGMIFEIFFLIAFVVKRFQRADLLCEDPFFIILRSGGEIMIFIFLIIGIQITKQIKNFQRTTQYEKTKQLIAQREALQKLCRDKLGKCGVHIENMFWNEFTWIISRCVTNIFWVIPIVYVFWPELLFSKKRVIKEKRSINTKNQNDSSSKNQDTGSFLGQSDDEANDDEDDDEIYHQNNYAFKSTDEVNHSQKNYMASQFRIISPNRETHTNRPSNQSDQM
ncbi:UNKNOWN [Stylonychia lemnae]|uniref:Uncharacterized protein n=1 Tax=Stylonychia lemnae TaxID=5949 RepID=A0A077ZRL2_STYLE|nr:UNKNOWN [Stylonychia lemnae]|eukprot:CDW72558.1 UNKNOWN [Stylonychia lemnae]